MGILDGKVAIVTGAARGQGAAEARLFLVEGCKVAATDIDDATPALEGLSGEFACWRHDVASEEDWRKIAAAALDRFGRIDILINNAGVFRPGAFQETERDDFDLRYRVNQIGVFLGMKTVAKVMIAAGSGSIVNVSSVAALSGSLGAFAYATSKWAIRGMTKCAARDLASTGVRVNAILPGLIDTRMAQANPPARNEAIKAAIPLGRIGRPDDVAPAALYLASDASCYMTGAELTVDGGLCG